MLVLKNELDVHLSKDGYLIVMHDETVDHATDGHGEIQQLTLNELKQLMLEAGFRKSFCSMCSNIGRCFKLS